MLASNTRVGSVADSALRRRVRARLAREYRRRERRKSIRWSARWFSGVMLLCIIALLLQFAISSSYYVHAITLEGVSYFSSEEILGLIGVSRANIFWLDQATIRDRLLRQPGIAEAQVHFGWPLGSLHIRITEKPPIFAWQVGERVVWVSEDGHIMPQYLMNIDLPVVHSWSDSEQQLAYDSEFTATLVSDVQTILQRIPTVKTLLFDPHPSRGIGYWHSQDTIVWYGRGGDFSQKFSLVNAIAEFAVREGVQLAEINVAQSLAHYYRTSAGD